MSPTQRTRHLTTAITLDLLEHRLDGRRLVEVETHLGRPCADCREKVRALGELIERLRPEPLENPPAWLERRAIEVFRPVPAAARLRALGGRVLELVFDSLVSPMPAAARRSVGEARRLRFALESCTVELETDLESTELAGLRGRLSVEEPALHRVEIRAGAERRTAWPDAGGAFAFDHLPRRRLHVSVSGPSGAWRLPPFTP